MTTPQQPGSDGRVGESTLALVEDVELTHPHSHRPSECWGARHTLALMGFLGFSTVYAMRVNLSVAIVAMVKGDPNDTDTNSNSEGCPKPDGYDPEDHANADGEFDWNEAVQGQILGSFYIGYLFTNLLGGRAAEYLGGKLVYGLGIFLTAIFTLLTPLCARTSLGLFIALRILEGVTEGVTFPAMNAMLSSWVPPLERAKFSSLVFAGSQFGTVITLTASGWLCDSDFLGGWPSVFYVFGAVGVLWSIAWYFLAYNTPAHHPRISQQERNYILHECGAKKAKTIPVPWKAVFTSLPMLSLIVVHFGQNWGFNTLLTELPTYLKNIQHFDMKSSGFLSALPYLFMWLFSVLFSALMDRLMAANILSIIASRKIAMVVGLYGPMLGLIGMCFVKCDSTLAMVVLCLAVGLNGGTYSGYMCSHQDLAPNFAGSLMGITNTVATIPGILAPPITGAITNDNQTLQAWQTVFLIASAVYLVTNIGYLVFMTDQVQPWNSITSDDNTSTKSDDKDEKKRY